MYLLPAIDLLDGKVVRLAQGDYQAVTVYHSDPVAQAHAFAEQGARWLHVVDLNGARSGSPQNIAVIERLARETDLALEVGGGLRSLPSLERLVLAGVRRLVVGTTLITDPDFCKAAVREFGDLISAGVDARAGRVAIRGWLEEGGIPAVSLIEQLASWGLRHLVYTDIARDGMQTGIEAAAYQGVAEAAGFAVTASGGVGSLEDIRALAALGDKVIEAVIVGRALYEGSFSVTEACEVLGPC
jgi:phosphoribosylformimino-5-aminoimidazole carboxamide ribotide isomerase